MRMPEVHMSENQVYLLCPNMCFPSGQCRRCKTRVRYLGQEVTVEWEMAPNSSIPAWRILWTEEPGGPQSMRSQRLRHD